MSWKGTLRSISAAQKRAERESKKRQRELERQRKQAEKMAEVDRASYEVQVFENYIDILASVHKDCGDTWDWEAICSSDMPPMPVNLSTHEKAAQSELDSYVPSRFDKLRRRVESKRNELVEAIEIAKREDDKEYQEALEDYKRLTEIRDIGNRILAGDGKAYLEALNKLGPFAEISELGSSINFNIDDVRFIEVELHVNGEDIVPSEIKTQLKSGKLSVKSMPKTRFYEIYQDHVCGCVLRVARELYSLLPIEMAIVTAYSELLNTRTGYKEDSPILSVVIPRDTVEKLNFDALDPSDSMDNFVHQMKFQKTKGFNPVNKIDLPDLQ